MSTRRINKANLVTIISVAILVGSEILGAALATAYALGSLLELGRELTMGLLGLSLLIGLWGVWKFTLLANRVEPVFEDKAV